MGTERPRTKPRVVNKRVSNSSKKNPTGKSSVYKIGPRHGAYTELIAPDGSSDATHSRDLPYNVAAGDHVVRDTKAGAVTSFKLYRGKTPVQLRASKKRIKPKKG